MLISLIRLIPVWWRSFPRRQAPTVSRWLRLEVLEDRFAPALAIPGSVDRTYGNDGYAFSGFSSTDFAHAVVQPDGKLIVTGISGLQVSVARFNADGTSDTSFDGDGLAQFTFPGVSVPGSSSSADVALDGDRIVVAGSTGVNVRQIDVVRLTSAGALDSTFGSNGFQVIQLTDIPNVGAVGVNPASFTNTPVAIQGNQILVDTGLATSTGQTFVVLRLNADGTLDNGFGNSPPSATPLFRYDYTTNVNPNTLRNVATTLAVDPRDNRILLAGSVDIAQAKATSDDFTARIAADGSALDNTFNANGAVPGT